MDEDGSGTVDFEVIKIIHSSFHHLTAGVCDTDEEKNCGHRWNWRHWGSLQSVWYKQRWVAYYRREKMCSEYTVFLSSFIDTEELMGVMVMMGNPRTEEEVQIMISEEDKNGDGLIDREEFFAMLQKGK